jgi:L-alanine-DL-glutamate epimerase-like enolase superfamily enzyme
MLTTDFERISLRTEHPFTIARETIHEIENVIVRVEDDEGHVGLGGAAPSRRYGETVDTVAAVLPALLEVVEQVDDPQNLQRIEGEMDAVVRDNPAAKAAVSIALHDLVAKRAGLPVYRHWGLDPADTVTSSFTIAIDSLERMAEKTADAVADGYSILKVKLGTDRDRAIIETVREHAPDATIRVDANEAWTPPEAVQKIQMLADYDAEFVEQPLPADHDEGLRYVYERSALPIALDESCVTLPDVPHIADRADIANLKLMKCGGLRETRRMIHAARAHGLEVMLGCMIESNASIAAAAHLAPLLDYADLDGSLLLAEDPYDGVDLPGGSVDLEGTSRAGTGAQRRQS